MACYVLLMYQCFDDLYVCRVEQVAQWLMWSMVNLDLHPAVSDSRQWTTSVLILQHDL